MAEAIKVYGSARFGIRSDTLENWEKHNPVLEKGEPSIVEDVFDEDWLKIGNGTLSWTDLPYKKGSGGKKIDALQHELEASLTRQEAKNQELASLINDAHAAASYAYEYASEFKTEQEAKNSSFESDILEFKKFREEQTQINADLEDLIDAVVFDYDQKINNSVGNINSILATVVSGGVE